MTMKEVGGRLSGVHPDLDPIIWREFDSFIKDAQNLLEASRAGLSMPDATPAIDHLVRRAFERGFVVGMRFVHERQP